MDSSALRNKFKVNRVEILRVENGFIIQHGLHATYMPEKIYVSPTLEDLSVVVKSVFLEEEKIETGKA